MLLLRTSDSDFEPQFAAIVEDRRETGGEVARQVSEILCEVKQRGDAALRDYSLRFDQHDLARDNDWSISAEKCESAHATLGSDLRDALELAAERIRAYHQKQLPQDRDFTDETGVRQGAIWRAVDAAGLYVPGGRAVYPSSLLMNAIPAKIAGVERLVVTTPTPRGEINPLVLAAAHIAGVDEIWRIGGAHAMAALAYGTRRIAPVDVITGPGNAYVAEAKRQLYGTVGIDMVAGPSEILIIADAENDPRWIATDLLSQAEHDPSAQSILITDDEQLARTVGEEASAQIDGLSTHVTARASWDAHGLIIVVGELSEAVPLANRLAAEHIELAVDQPEPMLRAIRHAGSVFLGRMTPEAIGDYVAGPNHVLPTGRRARFASGLSVLDFMKRTSFIELDEAALNAIGPAAITLANAEGLPAHAKSVEARLK